RSPRTNRCVAIRDQQGLGYLPDGTTRLHRDGEPLRHFMGTSTFAEAAVLPEIALAKVNPEAPLEGCAPFACGLSTGIGAALITGRRVTGSSFGGVKGRTQVPQYVERWLRGEIDVESLISHRLTLDEVNRGFELLEEQEGIRSVIEFA